MTERTYNIIMACKHIETGNIVDGARQYMSKECDVPIEEYTESQMSRIMKVAMYDYIDSCDKPSIFLRQFMEVDRFYEGISLGERIACALRCVLVKDKNGNYINGFGEWMK